MPPSLMARESHPSGKRALRGVDQGKDTGKAFCPQIAPVSFLRNMIVPF